MQWEWLSFASENVEEVQDTPISIINVTDRSRYNAVTSINALGMQG